MRYERRRTFEEYSTEQRPVRRKPVSSAQCAQLDKVFHHSHVEVEQPLDLDQEELYPSLVSESVRSVSKLLDRREVCRYVGIES